MLLLLKGKSMRVVSFAWNLGREFYIMPFCQEPVENLSH